MGALLQVILIAFSLALDAMSVSIAEGIETKKDKLKYALRVSLFFGGFQALMPLLGWLLGNSVKSLIAAIAPWVAFFLLTGIGVLMLKEALSTEKEERRDISNYKTLTLLAIATSIDAFIVGITLGLIDIPLFLSIGTIGLVTFLLCLPAFLFGYQLNTYFKGKLDLLGGIALILLGLKTIFTHLL